MAPKILLLTTEPLPIPGVPATGAGLRAWGLGFGLRSAGFDNVVMAFAADAVRGRREPLPPIPGVRTFERAEMSDFIEAEAPDAVVFQHWGLWSEVRRPIKCPVAMDLAGPHLLERRLWNSPDPARDLREKLTALAAVDHVVCSGQFQRHYFLPFLVQAGHDPRSPLCPVIPFSLAPGLPEPSAEREHDTFVFGGMFLPWQDPERPLRALLETMDEKGRGKLIFIGGPHPSGDVSGGRFEALLDHVSAHPRVERHGLMAFDQFLGLMRRAGVALDLFPRNAERELAFPTRTVTYLWAGLPVIHNDYDELAEPIAASKAGWTFDAADEDGLRKRIGRLLTHREDVDRASERARALVRERYTWDKTISPLADWCRDPRPRADKRPPVLPGADLSPAAAQTPAAATPGEPAAPPARRRRRVEGTISYAPRTPVTDVDRGPWYLRPAVFLLALPVSAVLLLLFGLVEVARLAARRG